MKKYKVDSGLKPYITRAVKRNFGSCNFSPMNDDDDHSWCFTELGADVFHRIVLRARCEKKSLETGELYMTKAESLDGILRSQLMKEHGVHSFRVIDCA